MQSGKSEAFAHQLGKEVQVANGAGLLLRTHVTSAVRWKASL